jgi:hypothetical protein
MSLLLSVTDLENNTGVSEEERDLHWAASNCLKSKHLHLYIWRFRPERRYVKEVIIPLLKECRKGVVSLLDKKAWPRQDRQMLQMYVENIQLRIENLERNYLNGKPSNFVTDEELRKAVGSRS